MDSRRQFLQRTGRGAAGLGLGFLAGAPKEAHPPWPPSTDVAGDAYWDRVRSQFPVTYNRYYLNTGGLGPAPYPVLDVVQKTLMDLQRISEHGHSHLVEAKAPVARFLGARPSEIAFMRNATEANATVASGLVFLEPGDEVILETHAHPGGAIPWLNRQKQQGIRVRAFEPASTRASDNLNRIEALLTPRTRVIQVSHLTAPTGIRMPVAEIARLARDRGIWFHVDGAQSAGAFPFNLSEIGCDSYGTSGHKWMCGPHGTGVLFVREERLDEVQPTEVGAYSDDGRFDIPDLFEYAPTAQRYESGTRDAATVRGLAAAVQFLEAIGMDRVAAYGQELARYLQDALRAIPGVTVLTPDDAGLSAAMTTFKAEALDNASLYRFLSNDWKLRCRIVTERTIDAIRISTHIFNNKLECDRVIEGVQDALRNL